MFTRITKVLFWQTTQTRAARMVKQSAWLREGESSHEWFFIFTILLVGGIGGAFAVLLMSLL